MLHQPCAYIPLSILSRFNFNQDWNTEKVYNKYLSILSRFNFNHLYLFCKLLSFYILSILSRFNFNVMIPYTPRNAPAFQSYQGSILTSGGVSSLGSDIYLSILSRFNFNGNGRPILEHRVFAFNPIKVQF